MWGKKRLSLHPHLLENLDDLQVWLYSSITSLTTGQNAININVKCSGVDLRETLKPNTLSYSFMSFFSRVLFPAPDGPLSTTGLGPAIAEGELERRVETSG